MLFRPSGVLIKVRLGARDGLLTHFLRDAPVINPFVVLWQIGAQTVNAGLGKVGGFGATEVQETAFLLLGRAAPRGDRRTGCAPPTALVCPKPVHLSSSFASALQVRNCIVGDSTIQGTK